MKPSTPQITPEQEQALLAEAEQRLGAAAWEHCLQGLPVDLEATARQTRALRRRRQVKSAEDLLRIILMYSVCDWSLRLTGAWAHLAHLASVSDVGLLRRFQRSCPWMGHLVTACLEQGTALPRKHPGATLCLRDATTISQPGSTGTDWRLHLNWDMSTLTLTGVELTDAHGGESLARFATTPETIVVADRGYAYARSLGAVLAQKGQLLVRINWQNLPLVDPDSPRWKLAPWLKRVTHPSERAVTLQTPQGVFPLRLVAVPLPRKEAQAARQRAQETARKKHHKIRPETLRAAGFILLVTNLPASEWSVEELAELYRWRWQVEVAIKRVKSIEHLDALRAKDPDLAQTYLLGKVLGTLLVEREQQAALKAGADALTSEKRPVSLWRLTQLGWEGLRHAIIGTFRMEHVQACLPQLRRYLCEPPRRRPQKLAVAQALWARWFPA